MRINPSTMLFEDFTLEESQELYKVARELVFDGKVPYPHPEWLTEWFKVCGFDERQALLVITTVLPQRILFSVCKPPHTCF